MDLLELQQIFDTLPGNYIILAPDTPKFTILSYNQTRAHETFTNADDIGTGIFEAFPDNPDDLSANGVAMLRASLEAVLREKKPHQMAIQKYDIPTSDKTGFETRFWSPKNLPVLGENGEVKFIIHAVKDVTTHVLAEKRGEENRQNFQGFLDQSNSPFAILTGREFMFTYANPAYIELMNDRQLVGKKMVEAIPELHDQPFLKQLQHVFDTGESYHGIEVPATARFKGSQEATTRFFNLSYTALKTDEAISGVLAYAYDVTEQVAMREKQQLHKLNEQAYSLFMQAPVAICILKGAEYTIQLANPLMLDIWGKESSIINQALTHALPEIKTQGFIELLDRVTRTGEAFYASEHETNLVRGGVEETAYINFVYQPYYDNGKITGIIAIATEVTEQVLSRKKVEYAEETLRLAMESAKLGTYEISLVTDEMLTSPRFNAIWGLEETVSRTSFAAAIHPDDRESRIRAHEESLVTGNLFYETRVIWQDQSIHWIRINGTVLYDQHKKPVRLIGVIQDITEQRAFGDEMKRQVDEKTRDLQFVNHELERSNKELEQFAYITSHDLQEPLRKIQIYGDRLLKGKDVSAESIGYIDKINASAFRMTGLIRELLNYARLSRTDEPLGLVDLNEILCDVIVDFELRIVQSGAHIQHDRLETISAIPLQINQLFYNLLGNALKFCKPEEAPRIQVRGKALDPSGYKDYPGLNRDRRYYCIEFIDNGIGFNQAYADKMFEVFQRLHQKTEYGGYGIGLAMCNRIVQNHKGVVQASGVEGEGAVFTVVLPFDYAGR